MLDGAGRRRRVRDDNCRRADKQTRHQPRHLLATAGAKIAKRLSVGRHCHSTVGVLSQLAFLPAVRREELQHREKAEEVIAFLGLERYRDTLIANLPYGVRKVVELGRALCIEPKLLLLDEPSSGLNVEETEGMGFWIEDIKKDLGITVIMVEHDMNLVRMVSDRVMALNYGKVIALGTPAEVQNHPEVVRAYIGGEGDDSVSSSWPGLARPPTSFIVAPKTWMAGLRRP